MLPDSALVDAIVDHLTANRPSGLSASVTIRREGDTEDLDSPRLILSASEAASPQHPAILYFTLTADLLTQTDDTTTASAEAWISAVRDAVTDSYSTIRTTLYDSSIILLKLVPSGLSTDPSYGPRLRRHLATWSAIIQTTMPSTS